MVRCLVTRPHDPCPACDNTRVGHKHWTGSATEQMVVYDVSAPWQHPCLHRLCIPCADGGKVHVRDMLVRMAAAQKQLLPVEVLFAAA
jgi:hypothetical protein